MDATHDVDSASPEHLRQGIRQTSQALENDVERLQEVVRDGAERARRAFFVPEFVSKSPLRACVIAAGIGFLASRLRSERRVRRVSRRVVSGAGGGLAEFGIAAAARAIQSALFRR